MLVSKIYSESPLMSWVFSSVRFRGLQKASVRFGPILAFHLEWNMSALSLAFHSRPCLPTCNPILALGSGRRWASRLGSRNTMKARVRGATKRDLGMTVKKMRL